MVEDQKGTVGTDAAIPGPEGSLRAGARLEYRSAVQKAQQTIALLFGLSSRLTPEQRAAVDRAMALDRATIDACANRHEVDREATGRRSG